MTADKHDPVLLEEALAGLAVVSDGCYVDGTYGRGGHSGAILARLGPQGRLLALDKDPTAVEHGRVRFAEDVRFTIVHRGFEELLDATRETFGARRVQGVLLDLGLSSPQLDEGGRGFSFARDGPLDMRFDPTRGVSAAEWLATIDTGTLTTVLREFGEERHSRRIAQAIVARRSQSPITRTGDLAAIVTSAVGRAKSAIHPATRAFQALRIVVNRELEALEAALQQSLDVLAAGGRLAVISFHSLEDRIVKRFIASQSRGDPAYAGLPEMPVAARPRLSPVGKLIRPGDAEVRANPRARSARLRVAERLAWDLGGRQ